MVIKQYWEGGPREGEGEGRARIREVAAIEGWLMFRADLHGSSTVP